MFSRLIRRCAPLLAVAGLAAGLIYFVGSGSAAPALSFGNYPGSLPNGDYLYSNSANFPNSNNCLLCHGGTTSILGSSTAGYLAAALRPFSMGSGWGGHPAAASADTDGDGFTNGEELQDPAGAWAAGAAAPGDQTFVSNPNWSQKYPPAPIISSITGLASNQTISGKVVVNVALRYAGLSQVVYTFSNTSTSIASNFTVASPAVTNYAAAYCLGYTTAAPGACTAWDSSTLPDGVYAVTVTAYDKRAAGLGGPQVGTLQLSGVTIRNAVPTAVPPTATPTKVPPTATPTAVPPTATPTNVPPTSTPVVPPTATSTPVVPPTSTPVVPPTSTPVVPPTSTPIVPPTQVPSATPIPPSSGAAITYVVQRGDTLYRIASRFGTTVRAIMIANNLRGAKIYVGQVLTIPAGSGPVVQPTPTEPHDDDHVSEVKPAESHTSDESHASDDKLTESSTESRAPESSDTTRKTYTVQAGDNLFRLGLRFRVSVQALQRANGLRSTYIRAGQVLVIP